MRKGCAVCCLGALGEVAYPIEMFLGVFDDASAPLSL